MIETEKKKVKEDCILTITAVKLYYNEKLLKEGGGLDKSCDKAEGARLLETMQKMKIREDAMQTHT